MIEDGRLYGRGSADDGYAVYAAFTVVQALDAQAVARPRCVGLIETCEESGSPDLPAYLELLAPRMGEVQLVVGLDSGCGNYDQLWVTTSLRGLVGGVLTVEVLTEGVHSGDASGVVPSSFRIARQLLGRVEHAASGVIIPPTFHAAAIPDERISQAEYAGEVLGDVIHGRFLPSSRAPSRCTPTAPNWSSTSSISFLFTSSVREYHGPVFLYKNFHERGCLCTEGLFLLLYQPCPSVRNKELSLSDTM